MVQVRVKTPVRSGGEEPVGEMTPLSIEPVNAGIRGNYFKPQSASRPGKSCCKAALAVTPGKSCRSKQRAGMKQRLLRFQSELQLYHSAVMSCLNFAVRR